MTIVRVRCSTRESRMGRRAHRMIRAASFLAEHGWEGGTERESGLRIWLAARWPLDAREVLIYPDGTAWLYTRGKEDGPHCIHREKGWGIFRIFVTDTKKPPRSEGSPTADPTHT